MVDARNCEALRTVREEEKRRASRTVSEAAGVWPIMGCQRIAMSTRLMVGTLIAACALCSSGPDGGERIETWLDNEALPVGRRVALIVIGVVSSVRACVLCFRSCAWRVFCCNESTAQAKRGITEHALLSIQANVVEANGSGDRVHVFVHTH